MYRTDAKVRPKIQVVFTFPVDSHTEIVYPVAIMRETKMKNLSWEFLEFLRRSDVQRELEALGFIPISVD